MEMYKVFENEVNNGDWTKQLNHLRTCIGNDYEYVYEAACSDQKNGIINGFVLRLTVKGRCSIGLTSS